MKKPHGSVRPMAFFEEAMATETDKCIVWPHSKARGYPKMWVDGRLVSVHRLSCEQANGPLPSPALEAAHNCGNRSCINKRHLRWATRKENHADKILHGTTNRGERQGNSKLTTPDVLAIRSRLGRGETHHRIAADFGVAREAVTSISTGRAWGWL